MILKKIKKFYKGFKVAQMLLYSRITGKKMPIGVSFHITNRCNLRCSYCYANIDDRFNKKVRDFTTQEVKDLIDELYDMGMRWLIILGGEPLVRNDIGEITKYVNKKGILCELVTNGQLVKEKIEEIKDVDSICFSIDGDEESNDKVRGKGSYKKIIEGLKEASKREITCRLHAVLSKHNKNCLEHLSKISRENNVSFGYSQAIIHDYNRHECFELSDEEIKDFWRELKRYKDEGHPVYNSNFALKKIINWPLNYNKLVRDKNELPKEIMYKYPPCFLGKRYCYIDSEGVIFLCICHGVKNGLNYREVGLKKAFDNLSNMKCETCGLIQYVETNNYVSLSFSSIAGALNYFRK